MDVIERDAGSQESVVEQVNIPARAPPLLNTKHIIILGLVGGCIGCVVAILSSQGILPNLFLGIGIGITVATLLAVVVLYLVFTPNIAHNRVETEGRRSIQLTAKRSSNIILDEPIAFEQECESPSTERELVFITELSTILEVTSTSEDKGSTEGISEPGKQTDVEATSGESDKSESTEPTVPSKAELSTAQERASTLNDKEESSEGVSDSFKQSGSEDTYKSGSPSDESVKTQPLEIAAESSGKVQSSTDSSCTSK